MIFNSVKFCNNKQKWEKFKEKENENDELRKETYVFTDLNRMDRERKKNANCQ